MNRTVCGIVCAVGLIAGCGKEETKVETKTPGGVQINAPGVNIKVGEGGGTEVNAPGASVKVPGSN